MNMKQGIYAQFERPQGVLGRLAGFIMANRGSNIERNQWTLQLLDLQPGDRVLELGFGPGIAIVKAAEIVREGLVVGIDHSQTMLRQASNRNAAAIAQGRVRLQLGRAENLPAFDCRFDKIYSANVVQFWRDPVAVFADLSGLLAPGGILATTYMARHAGASDADTLQKADEIGAHLRAAGFGAIRTERKAISPVCAVCVLAVKGENPPGDSVCAAAGLTGEQSI